MEELKFPMLSQSKLFSRLALVALTLPVAGFSTNLGTSISANGTCLYGSGCPVTPNTPATSVGVPPASSPSTGTFNFNYTFALPDGDKYAITGSYANSYGAGGIQLSFLPNVTYVGTSPSTTADSITLTMFQAFYDPTPSPWDGTFCETIAPFGIPGGDSVSGIVTYDGNAGLGSQPGNSGKHCAPLTFTSTQNMSDYMDSAFKLTFDFAKGTDPGIAIVSTPEPVQTVPVALSLIGLFAAFKTRKSRS